MSRTLLVGFDGATLDLALRWQEEGRMPNLRALCNDGSFGVLRSTFPFNSAVAWTSLSTGINAGRHGIFDFLLPREGEYKLRVATREDRRVPALWNHATDAGARVAVVNIPMTFPAEPVNGIMVSGMDAPSLEERSVYPAAHFEELRRMAPDYRIMSKAYLRAERGEWEAAERELVDVVVARGTYVAEVARARDMDLVMVNLEATDGAHHFFWQHFDPSHPRHVPELAARFGGTIGRAYEAVDRELGRIIDAYGPDTVIVVSDHGGGPSNDWVLFMNDWLAAEGYLRVRPTRSTSVTRRLYAAAATRLSVPMKRRLRPMLGKVIEQAKGVALYGDVAWEESLAYATVQPMVRLNLVGREPQGAVTADRRDGVLRDLADHAGRVTLPSGEPLFSSVRDAGDVYAGQAPGAPDLVVEPQPGVEVRGRNTTGHPGFLLPLSDLGVYYPSGIHTPLGLVVAAGTGVEHRGLVGESDIHQVAPSVLALMGVPAPQLDAGPFDFVTSSFVSTGAEVESAAAPGTDFSEEEEAEVLERLRGLGYVD